MTDITIVGAGLAGLLAANMLRARRSVRVVESQPELPNNHSAVLRFRSHVVADVLGIPFKRVVMVKGSVPWLNPAADAMSYSRKTGGQSRTDRSIFGSDFDAQNRYIAPPDLIKQMSEGLRIDFRHFHQFGKENGPVISTIPMPHLMKLLRYPKKVEFREVHGFNLRARIRDCEAYATLYIPGDTYKFNRVSITGSDLIAEYSLPGESLDDVRKVMESLQLEEELRAAAELFGLNWLQLEGAEFKLQRFSKVLPIDDTERKEFIHWATDKFGIYSLGRYATWRPGLLMDDLVNDIRLIERWITTNSNYALQLHR